MAVFFRPLRRFRHYGTGKKPTKMTKAAIIVATIILVFPWSLVLMAVLVNNCR